MLRQPASQPALLCRRCRAGAAVQVLLLHRCCCCTGAAVHVLLYSCCTGPPAVLLLLPLCRFGATCRRTTDPTDCTDLQQTSKGDRMTESQCQPECPPGPAHRYANPKKMLPCALSVESVRSVNSLQTVCGQPAELTDCRYCAGGAAQVLL